MRALPLFAFLHSRLPGLAEKESLPDRTYDERHALSLQRVSVGRYRLETRIRHNQVVEVVWWLQDKTRTRELGIMSGRGKGKGKGHKKAVSRSTKAGLQVAHARTLY